MYIKNNVVCQCDDKNQCRWNMQVCHAFKWERYQYSYRQIFQLNYNLMRVKNNLLKFLKAGNRRLFSRQWWRI